MKTSNILGILLFCSTIILLIGCLTYTLTPIKEIRQGTYKGWTFDVYVRDYSPWYYDVITQLMVLSGTIFFFSLLPMFYYIDKETKE